MNGGEYINNNNQIKPETKAAYADEAENQGRTPDG